VPGSPLDPRAAGTNDLIKQGATLTTEASDVINAVEPIMGRPLSLREPDDEPLASEPDAGDRARIIDLTRAYSRSARRSHPDGRRLASDRAHRAARARTCRPARRHGGGLVSLV